MAKSFYASVKYVREAIMRRWLVFHAILLSLTLLLYETVVSDGKPETALAVRQRRNAFNEGLEENVDKLWHDLEKYQNDKHTLQQFEKLVVEELKIKSEEIDGLKVDRLKQSEEISQLKQAIAKLLSQNAKVQEKLEDIKIKQTNQQHQISGLEFSDEKLTAGMGKLIVETGELDGKVDSLNKESAETKEKLTNVKKVTEELHDNVATLLEERKLVHDVVERIALLAEKTSVMSDRLHALQEHQTVSEKEITGLKSTMERLVASMRAVDKSQIQVSNHMDALDYNVSDHDMLINELLKTQTRDSRILREKMEDLMAKSATQTKAFEELKVQTAQASNRFSALTASIAKVSQRNDQLREKIDALKDSSAEFKASWDSSDIDELKSTQQILMNQLHKLGNAEVVLASELKRFPNLVNQLTDDIRRTKNDQSEREAAFQRLKSETDALKLQIRNLQPQPKPGGHRGYQHDQSLEDELELLNLRRGRRDVSETAASNGLLDRKVVTTNSAASGDSATLSSTHNIHKRARHRRKNTAIKDWRLWHTQHRKRTRAVSGLRRGPTPDITDNSKQDTTPR